MPLRCKLNGKEIHSFNLSKEEWVELKKNYRSEELRTFFCNSRCIPKTSSLGTQFFSHFKRLNCNSAHESKEHLLVKEITALVAQRNGWVIKTEYGGTNCNGERWIADVYCEKDYKKIVFEVQLSPQTNEETERRQLIYKESGIRACWFVKKRKHKNYFHNDLFNSFETPLFEIKINDENKFVIDRFNVSLESMVDGMLNNKLKWSPKLGDILSARIHMGKIECWKCNKEINEILGAMIVDKYGNQLGFIHFDVNDIAKLIKINLSKELCNKYKIGKIKHRYSKVVEESYNSNGCYYCGALLGNFYLHEATFIEIPITEFNFI